MLLFNRKELTVTYSTQRQSEIRAVLSSHGIPYAVKVVNRNSPSLFSDTRARTGTFGQAPEHGYEYIIYVKRKDFKTASEWIGTNVIP